MSAIERFSQRLSQIKGVDHFLLTRNDGQLITHNLPDEPDDLASLVTLCGLNAQAIRKTIGFSPFRHLVCGSPRQDLIIFPLNKYFLGILKKTDADQSELIGEMSRFLQRLIVSNKAGA